MARLVALVLCSVLMAGCPYPRPFEDGGPTDAGGADAADARPGGDGKPDLAPDLVAEAGKPDAALTKFTKASQCDDKLSCTSDSCGSNGHCVNKAYSCDDKLSCTTDTCDGKGGCGNKLATGQCLIDKACHATGASRPGNACQVCQPTKSVGAWQPLSSCVYTLAGTGSCGFKDGPAATATFGQLTGVAVGPTGEVYVSDWANLRIRLVKGGQVSTFAGTSSGTYADGPSDKVQLSSPKGLVVDKGGTVFFLDGYRVRKIAGGQVTTVAGSTTKGKVDGPAASARFAMMLDLDIDSKGTVYVADYGNSAVRRISGGTVSTVSNLISPRGLFLVGNNLWVTGGTTQSYFGMVSTGGSVHKTTFGSPAGADYYGMAAGPSGTHYVADRGTRLIRGVSGSWPSLTWSPVFGSGTGGFVDGPAAKARFKSPEEVAVDSSGKVYVADRHNCAVRVIVP